MKNRENPTDKKVAKTQEFGALTTLLGQADLPTNSRESVFPALHLSSLVHLAEIRQGKSRWCTPFTAGKPTYTHYQAHYAA
jgi:hypothetical protein